MAVISPPILKILSDLDIDLMDVDSDMDYLRALMEATNSLTISNPSDRRIPILQKEVKRVRDNRRAKSQIVKKKVSTSKLLNRKDVGEKGKESNTGKLSRILRDTRGRVLSNEKKIDNLGPVENQGEGADKESFNPIIDGLNSIIETLRGDRKFNKKKTEKQRKEKENKKRASKEKLLEGAKGVWKGITKIAGTILSPFQKLWSDILGFLSAIFVGRVLYKLVDWVGNPENQGKIKSIFRFLKDWWPVLLGAYLVFGTGLVGFATGFISTLVGFAATLVGTVIPALISAATAMGPWGLAALALLGTAAIISTKKNKTDQKVDQSVKEVGAEETSNIIKEQQENRSPLQKAGDFLTGADQERKEQIQKLDTGTEKRYGFFGEIKPKEMNKGGEVPGSGNTDTVPAMLTPGEFVMTKGAVNKFGLDTLEGMNAAAGGTNKPTMGRYNEGGRVLSNSESATMQGGKVVSGNMSQSSADYNKKKLQLEKAKFQAISTYGFNSPEVNQVKKQLLILDGIPAEAIHTDKKGNIKVKGFSSGYGKTTISDGNQGGGFKRMVGGAADFVTGGMWDFDKRNRKGSPKDFGIRRMAGGLTDWATMGLTDFDKRGRGNLQFDPISGGKDKAWGSADEQAKRGEKQSGMGIKRGIGGALDFATMGMWDFDKQNPEGSPKDWGIRRMAGGLADVATMGRTDFDKRGKGIFQFNPIFGGKDKKWGVEPSSKKPKVTVAYQDQLTDSTPSTSPAGGNKKIPSFSAIAMRSVDKVRVLGISV